MSQFHITDNGILIPRKFLSGKAYELVVINEAYVLLRETESNSSIVNEIEASGAGNAQEKEKWTGLNESSKGARAQNDDEHFHFYEM